MGTFLFDIIGCWQGVLQRYLYTKRYLRRSMEEKEVPVADFISGQTVLEDISPLYYKVILKEACERVKICDSVALFLDDIANIEESFGKSLVKVSMK